MRRSAEFLLGLVAPDAPGFVSADDFNGPHADAVRRWQHDGLVGCEPLTHPVPSCPHCGEGAPYRLEPRCICGECRSTIDPQHFSVWPVHRETFFNHVAVRLALRGGVRPVDDRLWHLGSGTADGKAVECFYHPGGELSDAARRELSRYVRLLVLHGATGVGSPGRWFPLVELFDAEGSLAVVDLADLVRVRGPVRFDPATGVLRVGGVSVGEVAVGSKEFFLLQVLARELDQFVSYGFLKSEVLRLSGSGDATEEATFCQKLKSRTKKSIPAIDRLIVTTNKGDGYRLRAEGELG